MDILEFIHRLHEAKREAGGRPVDVVFKRFMPRTPYDLGPARGHVEITFLSAGGGMAEPTPPRIVITYQP